MMMRLAPLLGLAALCATGCTTSYRVYVNSYSELAGPVGKDVPIFVATDPKSRNPILDKQIKTKIERLMTDDGYAVVSTSDKAQYQISFQVAMRTEEYFGYAPYREFYWHGYGWHRGGYGFGYTTVVPYADTLFNQWLNMRLSQVTPGDPNEGKIVWVGEAMSETERPDLREALDYLLVADFEEFGLDTHGQVVISVRRDDPRLQNLKAAP